MDIDITNILTLAIIGLVLGVFSAIGYKIVNYLWPDKPSRVEWMERGEGE